MKSNKTIAKVVGILFIVVTVSSSLSIWITEPVFEATNVLKVFSDKSGQISGGAIHDYNRQMSG